MKNNKLDLIIIGGGGNSQSIISFCKKIKTINIIGYTDLINKGKILNVPYLGNENQIDLNNNNVVIGISYLTTPKDRELRFKLIKTLKNKKCKFPIIKSNSSIINKNVILGYGTIVHEFSFINVNTKIGEFSILNSSCVIEHDCIIGKNFFLGPNSTICGDVTIGDNVFIGAGSVVRDSVKINNNIIIGMGSVVTKNLNKPGVYYGNPLKYIP